MPFFVWIINQRFRHPTRLRGIEAVIHGVSTFLIAIFCVGVSIYGICLFVHKMYKLGQLMKQTQTEQESYIRQMKLLYATAKYISLLSISIVTS